MRLTETEQDRFAAFSAAHGLKSSEAARRLFRLASGIGPTFDHEASDRIYAWTDQMRAIGRNINQVVRAINTGLVPSTKPLVEASLEIIAALRDAEALYTSLCADGQQWATQTMTEHHPATTATTANVGDGA